MSQSLFQKAVFAGALALAPTAAFADDPSTSLPPATEGAKETGKNTADQYKPIDEGKSAVGDTTEKFDDPAAEKMNAEQKAQKAQDEANKAASETKDQAGKASDQTKDQAGKASDQTKGAYDETTDQAKQKTNQGSDKVKSGLDDLSQPQPQPQP